MQKKIPVLACALSLLFVIGCKPKAEVGDGPNTANTLTPFRTADGKWGYNKGGKTVIEAKFDNVVPFQNGTARIKVGDKYGFIDESGKILVEPKYVAAGRFIDGLAPVKIDANFGYIDKSGKVVIPAKYGSADDFNAGYASVLLGEESGYISKQGEYKKGDPPGTITEDSGVGDEPEEGGN
jgi:hypothetical protein